MLRPLPDLTRAAAAALSWPDPRDPEETRRAGLDADEPNVRRASPTSAGVDAATGDGDTADRDPADRDTDLPDLGGPACTLATGPDPATGPEAVLDPDSAPGPVVSAEATDCIDASVVPTPTATATAPTRAHPSAARCVRPDPAMLREPLTRSESGDALIGPASPETLPSADPVGASRGLFARCARELSRVPPRP